jgi:hypothetical protein
MKKNLLKRRSHNRGDTTEAGNIPEMSSDAGGNIAAPAKYQSSTSKVPVVER